jgi:putative membrane protein
MNRSKLMALTSILAAAWCAVPLAQAQSPTARPDLPRGERKFLEAVAQHDMAEIQTGKLADGKATNPEAKKFGHQMAQDHGQNYEEVVQLAKAKAIALPTQPDSSHKRETARLEKLSGAEFDRKYMDAMVKDHEKDVKAFGKMARSAKDPDVKAFAEKTLPVLEGHLRMARDAAARTHAKR